MKFTKMHGIGNDYVYVNGFVETISNPAEIARAVSDRHFGIGSDGLILILPSDKADVRMRMFNADGSEAEMCGNGVRCVAKYAYEHGLSQSNPMRVETGNGVLSLALHVEGQKVQRVTVNMGRPILNLEDVPVSAARLTPARQNEHILQWGPSPHQHSVMTFVSMGNPHAVIFQKEIDAIDLAAVGPIIEHHAAFPRRMNVHFVEVISPREVRMRTWERGSGITLACGTGACAVAVAGALTQRTGRQVLAHLPGGDLELDWNTKDNAVYMTGSATEVYSGVWKE